MKVGDFQSKPLFCKLLAEILDFNRKSLFTEKATRHSSLSPIKSNFIPGFPFP